MSSPVVSLRAVDVWFADGPRVLHNVSFDVQPGEHWALLGPNGAGKSTLLGVAEAQRFPSAGTVEILGHRLGRVDVRDLRRRIGAVDVRLRMPVELDVERYVATGATQTVQLLADPSESVMRDVEKLLVLLGLSAIRRRRIGVCSQGERARARLARALVADPALLLLDEPASGLDLPGRADLLDAVESVAAARPELASITVEHHLEELPATTSHVSLIRDGQLVSAGEVELLGDSVALGACFGRELSTYSVDGRWFAVAARAGVPRS